MTNSKKNKVGIVESTGGVKKMWTPFSIVMLVILIVYSLSLFGTLFWALMTALKAKTEYMRDPLGLPQDWLFSNFITAVNELSASGKSVPTMLFNSLWLAVLPPTINLFTAAMASYAMAHYKFPGRNLIWTIMIFMMTLPVLGTGAAQYKMLYRLNFYNSPLYVLKSVTGLGGSLFLIAAFSGVSKTYAEAAFIEGAGHFKIFFTIMLPQVSGVILALWTMSFITHWNDYMTPIMYLPDYTPLTTGLYIYQKENERRLNTPVLFAGSLLVLIVPVTLFAIFQDKFMNISFGGGIKG